MVSGACGGRLVCARITVKQVGLAVFRSGGHMSVTAAIESNERAIGEQPAKARVTFKADGALVGPTEVTLTARDHAFKVDEPEILGGSNAAANPVEYALAALAS